MKISCKCEDDDHSFKNVYSAPSMRQFHFEALRIVLFAVQVIVKCSSTTKRLTILNPPSQQSGGIGYPGPPTLADRDLLDRRVQGYRQTREMTILDVLLDRKPMQNI